MDAANIITTWYAPLCSYLPTKFCHLVTPDFYNAYGLFTDDIHNTGAKQLEAVWEDIAATFPNTYCFPLNPYTKVFEPGTHPNADGLHWTDTNYKDVSLPISFAMLCVLHNVKPSLLNDLVASGMAKVKKSPAKTLTQLSSFVEYLQNLGKTVTPENDCVQMAIKKFFAKLGLSSEEKEACKALMKKFKHHDAILY